MYSASTVPIISIGVIATMKPVQLAWSTRHLFCVRITFFGFRVVISVREVVAPVKVWEHSPRQTRATDRNIGIGKSTTSNNKMSVHAGV